MKQNIIQNLWLKVTIIIQLLCLTMGAAASSFHTSTKDCPFANQPCNVTGLNSFTISTAQTVKWTANYFGAAPQGNDFFLSQVGANMADIPLSNDLVSGMNSGTFPLAVGNYFISIQTALMGPGSYTIEFNLEANCNVSPLTHNFGSHDAGSAGADFDFNITLAGDLLDVEIGAIISTDPHFVIAGGAGTTLRSTGPTSVSFNVQFNPGATPGAFATTITIDTPLINGQNPPNKTITVSGATVPLVPDIDCVAQGSTPTVDWFGAGATVSLPFTKSFRNEGNATMNISAITLLNDAGGRFTFSGAPSTAPLPAGATRTVNLIMTVPRVAASEGTYTGTIRIVSDSPGEETKDCNFSARAHHPEPNMVVTTVPDGGTTADFHDVEIGFTFTKGIKVQNTGDAPLTLTLSRTDNADPDWAQWTTESELANAPVTIAAGSEQIFRQFFKPIVSGVYTTELTAIGAGGGGTYNRTDNVILTGRGVPPVPMHNVLVLDRSGSMESESVGSRTKIDGLQKAARLYYDLLRPDPGDGSGDQIAMVKYSDNAQDYFDPLQIKSPAIDLTVSDLLSEAATADNARLKPNGGTCISCGMLLGADKLLTSPDTVKQVLIVMTDGLETAGASITDQMLTDVRNANNDLQMYSVGLGDDINEQLLQRITNIGNGFHHVSEDLLGINHFALEEFYFKIYANASGADLIVDPTEAINLASGNPVEVNRATVVSSDRYAMFMVLDDPALASYYKLEFIDPHGSVLDPTSSIGGIPIQILKRDGHTIYKIIFPDISQAYSYVGDWVLRLSPTGKWKEGGNYTHDNKIHGNYQVPGEWIQPYQGMVPIGFGAAVKSDYNMNVNVAANNYQPGAQVLLTAQLSDRGWPSTGGQIDITATKPDATGSNFKLYDDGTHGDTQSNDGTYSNQYSQTALEGSYRFFFNGKGINERGELVPRQATRYVSLFAPDPPGGSGGDRPGGGKNCFPCWLYWLMLLLLIIILWLIIRCCRKFMLQKVYR